MRSMPFLGRQARAALGTLFAASLFVAPARADFVTATFSTVNPGEVVTINSTNPAVQGTGWAGDYDFTNASGALTGNFRGFCIDIAQDIYPNQTVTFTVAALKDAPSPGVSMGQTKANLIAELWYNDYGLIGTDNSKAAAFQVAIWEIINGGIYDYNQGKSILSENVAQKTLSNGTLTVTDSSDFNTLDTAFNWLKQLDPNGNGPKAGGLIALTSSTAQDYVVQVPAPTGWVYAVSAAVTLFLPLGWRRRKSLAFARTVR